jgi:hypothetical protein
MGDPAGSVASTAVPSETTDPAAAPIAPPITLRGRDKLLPLPFLHAERHSRPILPLAWIIFANGSNHQLDVH